MENDIDEALFAVQKKRTEQTLKKAVVIIALIFIIVLYMLIQNG